jgi:hypothetical protein
LRIQVSLFSRLIFFSSRTRMTVCSPAISFGKLFMQSL